MKIYFINGSCGLSILNQSYLSSPSKSTLHLHLSPPNLVIPTNASRICWMWCLWWDGHILGQPAVHAGLGHGADGVLEGCNISLELLFSGISVKLGFSMANGFVNKSVKRGGNKKNLAHAFASGSIEISPVLVYLFVLLQMPTVLTSACSNTSSWSKLSSCKWK